MTELRHYGYSVTDADGDRLSIQNARDGGLCVVAQSKDGKVGQGAVLAPVVARRFVGALLAILDGDPPEPNPDPAIQLPPTFPLDVWTGKGMAYAHVVMSSTPKNGVVITVSNTREAPGVRLDFVQAHALSEACLALLNGEDPEMRKDDKFPY